MVSLLIPPEECIVTFYYQNSEKMKKIATMLMVALVCACHHDTEPWKESAKEVDMCVRTAYTTAPTPPTGYQLFLFDSQNRLTAYTIPSSGIREGNHFQVEIPEGRYTGYCVANSDTPDVWEYSAGSTPSKVFVSLQRNGEFRSEAGDYLLGQSEFTIGNKNTEPILFETERKVGCVRVIIENIPDWMNDLHIRVSNIPPKMNLLGKYSGEAVTVSKAADKPDENGRSATDMLVFPPGRSSSLTLTYKAGVASESTPVYTIDSILCNRITEVRAIFHTSGNVRQIDFSTEISEWDETIIREEDWHIELPGKPCEGSGNGINLAQNGGFEKESADAIPPGWKLDGGGSDKEVSLVTSPVLEGQKAARIKGKTYLYQDIEVTAGECYQLHLFVNSPSDEVKWRYWSTWMAGATNLNSDAIRTSSYRYRTEGYEDVYAGNIFKAPAGATKLRIEVRSYSDLTVTQEGLYIDAVRIEKVE